MDEWMTWKDVVPVLAIGTCRVSLDGNLVEPIVVQVDRLAVQEHAVNCARDRGLGRVLSLAHVHRLDLRLIAEADRGFFRKGPEEFEIRRYAAAKVAARIAAAYTRCPEPSA